MFQEILVSQNCLSDLVRLTKQYNLRVESGEKGQIIPS